MTENNESVNAENTGLATLSGLETRSPEWAGITSASLLNLIDEAKNRNIHLHSLMVLRHGKVLTQLWWKPYAPDIPHHLYSFSKSVTAAAVGFAIDEGLLSLDDRIIKFFPRRVGEGADSRIYSVTVRHLLTMTSGIVLSNEATMFTRNDWVEWILNTPLIFFPGDKFVYNSLNSYMLSAILRRVTGMGLVEYLTPRLFEPLGIPVPNWDKCPLGIEAGGWGLSLRTEDMAKFCQLMLDDGCWNGRQILPEGWAQEAGRKQADSSVDSKLRDCPDCSSGYGYQFWMCRDGSFRCEGIMGQFGLVMKKLDMVIVTTASRSDHLDILDLLWDVFIPYVDIIPEGTAPSSDYDELCAVAKTLEMPTPVPIQRRREVESAVTGQTYSLAGNFASLLPLAVRYLHSLPPLGIDALRFDFDDEQCTLSWREDGGDKQLPFRLDGGYCRSTLVYGGKELDTVTCAAWTAPDTLEVYIRIIRTPHMQRARFRFDKDKVIYSFNEEPTLEEYAKTILDFIKPVRGVSPRLAKLADKITLSVTGTMEKRS
ncbi:MAG: serine hydrolase [Ruminococcaceae bacterium]|nr:serine hydrolase [Oscillospiraceae bacterium]